ncbi:hypothetical protein AB7Y06_03755 [Providencia rettgeri]
MIDIIHFPAPDNYAEKVNTETGIKELMNRSYVEELLRKLDSEGCDVSAALIELTAIMNYVNLNLRVKDSIRTHIEFIANELNK